jgi:glucose/mannose-6-phosphate isomerase
MDEAAVRRVDKKDIARDVGALPDHLPRGVALGANLGPLAVGRRVTVVGMGGSAIAGEVLAAWLAAERGLELAVVKDSKLPPWTGEGDLVVAVSYSGNTLETLAATREAVVRGADIAGISSGGTLRDLCKGRGYPFAPLPAGLMPRAAFGYVFGALSGLYDANVQGEVRQAAEIVRDLGKNLAPSVADSKNPAKKLAAKLKGRTPILYSTPTYAPVARRWMTELNEMAKVLAWSSVLPEADHNELVGWDGDVTAKRFVPVFLRDPAEAEDHARMMDVTRDLIKRRTKVEEVVARGPSLLSRMLCTLQLGDFTSVYLAVLRKVDPTPVAVIGRLKERLAKG